MSSFLKDENLELVLLSKNNQQVMMEWEKPYMEACIDFLSPRGDVLEVGFGCGYSASQIMKYPIKSYTVIESDPTVLQRLFEWKAKFQDIPITIIKGKWQDVLHSLGKFDSVFIDDFPLEISQHSTVIEKRISDKRIILFLELCVRNHTKIGSRISTYLNTTKEPKLTADSKPFVEMTSKLLDIKIPETCEYRDTSVQQCLVVVFEVVREYDYTMSHQFAVEELLRSLSLFC